MGCGKVLEDQIAGQARRVLLLISGWSADAAPTAQTAATRLFGYSSSMRNDYRNFAINFNMRVMSE